MEGGARQAPDNSQVWHWVGAVATSRDAQRLVHTNGGSRQLRRTEITLSRVRKLSLTKHVCQGCYPPSFRHEHNTQIVLPVRPDNDPSTQVGCSGEGSVGSKPRFSDCAFRRCGRSSPVQTIRSRE